MDLLSTIAFDPYHQEWYFWKHVSKESKWTRPKVGEPEEDNTLPKAGGS